ncbi:hypothetical protein ACOME3_008802 [Neoechinorhynchus agilis]
MNELTPGNPLNRGIDDHFLKWDLRRDLILNTIYSANCDILCLQEVQSDHYPEMRERLLQLGYEGCYIKRGEPKTDGCATFFRRSIFSLVQDININLQKTSSETLNHPNVAQIIILEHNDLSDLRICTANVHICFNPRRGDAKLAQAVLLLSNLHKYSRQWGFEYIPPIILAGDFNSASNSPLWKFVTGEAINIDNYSRTQIAMNSLCKLPQSFVPIPNPLLPDHLKVSANCEIGAGHNAKEARVYRNDLNLIPIHPGDMLPFGIYRWPSPFGNYYVEVDHIFYSHGTSYGLVPMSSTTFNYPNHVVFSGPIPSIRNGSDHYPLFVEFSVFRKMQSKFQNQ